MLKYFNIWPIFLECLLVCFQCMSLSALPVFCSGFCIFLFLVLSHLIVFAQSLVMFSVFYSVFFSLLAPHKRHCSVYSLPVAEMTKLSLFSLFRFSLYKKCEILHRDFWWDWRSVVRQVKMCVLPFACMEFLQKCRNTEGESCKAEQM